MPDTTTASGPKLVFLIRHWEKPGDPAVDNDADGPNLSTRGYEAAAFAINIPATFPKPDFLLGHSAVKAEQPACRNHYYGGGRNEQIHGEGN